MHTNENPLTNDKVALGNKDFNYLDKIDKFADLNDKVALRNIDFNYLDKIDKFADLVSPFIIKQ